MVYDVYKVTFFFFKVYACTLKIINIGVKIMVKILRTICIAFMLILIPVIASADCEIIIDGTPLSCEDAYGNELVPFVENGTAFVPMRGISEKFGMEFFYDKELNTLFLGEKCTVTAPSEQLSVFLNGEPFCYSDSYGQAIYPVVRNEEVYMPARAVGNLTGKNVNWDNFNQAVILTTPLSSDEASYLTNSIINTDSMRNVNQSLSFSGEIFYQGNLLSSVSEAGTVAYSPSVFSVSSMLDYTNITSASYIGNGKYFIYTTSEKFSTSPYIINAMKNSLGEMKFSPLYVRISTKGGYITNVSLHVSSALSYNGLSFNESIYLSSDIIYESGFSFPTIPYPEGLLKPGESHVFSESISDAESISDFLADYTRYALSYSSSEITKLFYIEDYNVLIGNKTSAQQGFLLSSIEKKLTSIYKHATGGYRVTSMIYVNNPETYPHSPERVAKIILEFDYTDNIEAWTEEVELLISKINGEWYLNSSSIKSLM